MCSVSESVRGENGYVWFCTHLAFLFDLAPSAGGGDRSVRLSFSSMVLRRLNGTVGSVKDAQE